LLFVVFYWDNAIRLYHLHRDLLDYVRRDVDIAQLYVFHPPLRRKSNLQLLLIYQPKFNEKEVLCCGCGTRLDVNSVVRPLALVCAQCGLKSVVYRR